jgi:hypothetical protein
MAHHDRQQRLEFPVNPSPKCHTLQRNKVPALTKSAGQFAIVKFRCAGRVERQKGNSVRLPFSDGEPSPKLRPQL